MNDYPLRVKIVAGLLLTAVLWLLLLPFDVLWILFSELCDWMDRRGQRRHQRLCAGRVKND
jgi:hypothetical protein